MTEELQDFATQVNQVESGYNTAMGLTCVRATVDEVIGEIEVGPQHLQPYGLVHGGVFAGMIETLCSVGAALNELPNGRSTVGQENTTSFLRAVRSGTIRCRAVPLLKGRRSHVWDAQIHDDQDRLVATGRVRILCLEAGAEAAGKAVRLVTEPTE